MKEESLKVEFKKVFLIYLVLGLIVVLALLWVDPTAKVPRELLYFIPPLNGFFGILREKSHSSLLFSKKGLRVSKDKIIPWEDLQISLQYSSKLFGKSYVVRGKTTKAQGQLDLNWWNEDELMRLTTIYTPEKHHLRKMMDEHEFGLPAQLSLTTKIRSVSFDYAFLVLACIGIASVKYF